MIRFPAIVLLTALASTPFPGAAARVGDMRIERIETAVAVLHDVQVRLEWPQGAETGALRLHSAQAEAPALGYRFRDLLWTCPLRRPEIGAWRCDGEVRSGRQAPMALTLDLTEALTRVDLQGGDARLALLRDAADPELTRVLLERVPLLWADALVRQAMPALQMQQGGLDGEVRIDTRDPDALRVRADLRGRGLAFDSSDGSLAGEGIGLDVDLDYRLPGEAQQVGLQATLHGARLLFGTAYLDLPETPIAVSLDAVRDAPAVGWRFDRLHWNDGDTLRADGALALDAGAAVRALDLRLHSEDTASLPARYLSGWLGVAGLSGMTLSGTLDAHLRMAGGAPSGMDLGLRDVEITDGRKRFRFEGLDGDLRISEGASVDSELRWRGGGLQTIGFGPARLPFRSTTGRLDLREDVAVDLLGGQLRFSGFSLHLPQAGQGMRIESALAVDGLRLGELASAFDWPAFGGSLSGEIPRMRYADQRLDFDGGLQMHAFDGEIRVASLALERPFGVAPSLSADIALEGLDLTTLTEVFDLGQISGRLYGGFRDLRLVDWQLAAFDAELHTERRRGTRQRISQRAVQDISSVGDASFAGTLQAQLIGFFDDFGYRRIGISCRLRNAVCEMGGLRSAGNAFTIVEGSGLPRLDVVGHNRSVDWPTLVERIGAAVEGDVSPVVE